MTTKTEPNRPNRGSFSFDERRASIQKFRKFSGLSQAQLARLAGVSQSKVSMFETGEQDLGEAAFGRVAEAVAEAAADRRLALRSATKMSTLAALLSAPAAPDGAHYLNIPERTKDGGFILEYQGPGMIVCEDYHFKTRAELLDFIRNCIDTIKEKIVLSSDLPEDDEEAE